MPKQEKQLDARAFARRGNCALGTQPPNPRAPPNTAPHLRSAGVVVVGLAASPAASAPIGHAAPPAAGGKGRRQQTLPHRELASFLKFEMAIMDSSDDSSHNAAWQELVWFHDGCNNNANSLRHYDIRAQRTVALAIKIFY